MAVLPSAACSEIAEGNLLVDCSSFPEIRLPRAGQESRSSSAAPCFLFVYGTLLKGFDSLDNWAERIAAEFVGRGAIQGRLYDLGEYPAATSSEAPDETVRGEVYALRNPASSIALLDEYEGFLPSSPSDSLFVRRPVRVAMDDGRTLEAWAYFFNRPVKEEQGIPGGDYRGR